MICLSTEYVNQKTSMLWRCRNGHTVTSCYASFAKSKKCAQCRNFSLDACQKEAEKHNGRCLGEIYTRIEDPIDWECEVGHTFTRSLREVMKSDWCPKCQFAKNVELTRK